MQVLRFSSAVAALAIVPALLLLAVPAQAQFVKKLPVYNNAAPASGNGVSYAQGTERPGITAACDWSGQGSSVVNYPGHTYYTGGSIYAYYSTGAYEVYKWTGPYTYIVTAYHELKIGISGTGWLSQNGKGSAHSTVSSTADREYSLENNTGNYSTHTYEEGDGSGPVQTQVLNAYNPGDQLTFYGSLRADSDAGAIPTNMTNPGAHSAAYAWFNDELAAAF